MKRLIRKSDAAKIHQFNLDPQVAISMIQTKDSYFKEENLILDTGANRKAFWGIVSNDNSYLIEAYVYKSANNTRKVAYVICPIINAELSNPIDVVIKELSGQISEIKSIISSGLTMNDGTKIECNEEKYNYEEQAQLDEVN